MTTEINNKSIEFTIRQTFFGSSTIYVRKSEPACGIGDWRWCPWRKANDSERNAATVKLMELNK